jgi:D-glycero-D-manno-heptose 1,7-bisphosphate phosphatase
MGVYCLGANRAVFLDRDGVINRNVFNPQSGEYESPYRPEDFELVPEVLPAIRRLQEAGFLLFVVSNQPGYAKGKVSLKTLQTIHARLTHAVDAAGIRFSAYNYCYHHPQGIVPGYSGACSCRKPSPFFLFKARDEYDVDLSRSWMIGDRATDIECGRAAGVRTIRVKDDHPGSRKADEAIPEFGAETLVEAVDLLIKAEGRLSTAR